ncbi:MAG: insulinase family protein [Deltaproteobacteria bacterium]|nr:insulinase family protein [Deltaproteobacteria bacterium]
MRSPARRRGGAWLVAVGLALGGSVTAAHAEVAPPLVPAPPASVAAAGPRLVEVEASTLPNGLRLWVQRTPGSGEAHVRFVVQAGSAVEPDNANGVAHFVEHVLFDRETDPAIHGLIQKLEANGAYYNAFTTVDMTYAVVDSFAADLEPALELVARSLAGASFTPEQIELERQIVARELAEKQDDQLLLGVRGQLYGDQAIARPEGGTPNRWTSSPPASSVTSTRRTTARPRWCWSFSPIARPRRSAARSRRRSVSSRGRAALPPRTRRPERNPGPIQTEDLDHTGALLHGMVAAGARDPDYYALWVLQELLEIRLYDRIRVHGGMSYAPYVYFTPNRHEGMLYLYASADENDFGAMADAFDAELTRVASGEIAPEEVLEARNRVANRFLREHLSGEDLANHLAWMAGVLEPNELPVDPVEPLKRVSRKDLKRVADRWGVEELRIDARSATPPGPEPEPTWLARLVAWAVPAGFAVLVLLQLATLRRVRGLRRALDVPKTAAAGGGSGATVTPGAGSTHPETPGSGSSSSLAA